jgi:hypothetical protein
MANTVPRVFVVVGVLLVASIASACAGAPGEAGAMGTSGTSNSALALRTTSQFVAVENRSNRPIYDVQVTIEPAGGVKPFTTVVSRLDGGETRNVPLDSFRGADGAGLNRMFVRPRTVRAIAADVDGQKHETAVAWAQ